MADVLDIFLGDRKVGAIRSSLLIGKKRANTLAARQPESALQLSSPCVNSSREASSL